MSEKRWQYAGTTNDPGPWHVYTVAGLEGDVTKFAVLRMMPDEQVLSAGTYYNEAHARDVAAARNRAVKANT
jgi:hypothetical protein